MARRLFDLVFLLIIPALLALGLMTEDRWDLSYSHGYSYPEQPASANLLGVWGASVIGWLRFHTGELVSFVPAVIFVTYALAVKLPFSLFSRTVLITALVCGGYHMVAAETLFATEQMGNLPFWLERRFPSMLPLLMPLAVLAALIGCGRLILRLVDPPEPSAESRSR